MKSLISIHALREEGDRKPEAIIAYQIDFYPRPPRGGRRRYAGKGVPQYRFLSTPSARRATYVAVTCRASGSISIHALREEGDYPSFDKMIQKQKFLSTPSARRATLRDVRFAVAEQFLSTPSARRATRPQRSPTTRRAISIHALREEGDDDFQSLVLIRDISIHALREEGDQSSSSTSKICSYFYPRPPRGGRPRRANLPRPGFDFYPRPPRGGRRCCFSASRSTQPISIHALREEGDVLSFIQGPDTEISIHALREEGDPVRADLGVGDQNFYPRPPRGGRRCPASSNCRPTLFLSTPSARRATRWPRLPTTASEYFYPRPPRGGRRLRRLRKGSELYFYPRPPRGGRRFLCVVKSVLVAFLSTPSARRATAKTETKSLFSNKLYNILHEFRRALIYNGSKSYPNHAK